MDEYDTDRDNHADKKESSKDKYVCSIDFLPATESYDDYDDDSVNVTVTEHSSRVSENESLKQ